MENIDIKDDPVAFQSNFLAFLEYTLLFLFWTRSTSLGYKNFLEHFLRPILSSRKFFKFYLYSS